MSKREKRLILCHRQIKYRYIFRAYFPIVPEINYSLLFIQHEQSVDSVSPHGGATGHPGPADDSAVPDSRARFVHILENFKIYWNLIISIPGMEYTGISSKVMENTGIRNYFSRGFSIMFIFAMPLNYC